MIYWGLIFLATVCREPRPADQEKRPQACPANHWIALPNNPQKRFASPDETVLFENFEALQKAASDAFIQEIMQPPRTKQSVVTFPIIAIDGGAGSGKTSTAKLLAERHGWLFISTGEHYRTLTAYFRENQIAPEDENAIRRALQNLRISTAFRGNGASMAIDGRVWESDLLRRTEITENVSHYAGLPKLRQFLQHYQRQLPAIARAAGFRGMVIEGRDMTSVVFPETPYRFILEANAEERARRRENEGLIDDVAARDVRDSAQMQSVDGVQHIDTTSQTLEAVVMQLENFLNRP